MTYNINFIYNEINEPCDNSHLKNDNDLFNWMYDLLQISYNKFEIEFNKVENEINSTNLYFLYLSLNDYFYKLRNEDVAYYHRAKIVCLKSIALLERGIVDMQKEIRNKIIIPDMFKDTAHVSEIEKRLKQQPAQSVPTLNRLITMYEKEGEINKAIELCKFGIFMGYNPKLANGWKGKVEQLKKKLKT